MLSIISLSVYALTETGFQPLTKTCPLKMLIDVLETQMLQSSELDLTPVKVTGNVVPELTESNFSHHE